MTFISSDQADEILWYEVQNDLESAIKDLIELVCIKIFVLRNEMMSNQVRDMDLN